MSCFIHSAQTTSFSQLIRKPGSKVFLASKEGGLFRIFTRKSPTHLDLQGGVDLEFEGERERKSERESERERERERASKRERKREREKERKKERKREREKERTRGRERERERYSLFRIIFFYINFFYMPIFLF